MPPGQQAILIQLAYILFRSWKCLAFIILEYQQFFIFKDRVCNLTPKSHNEEIIWPLPTRIFPATVLQTLPPYSYTRTELFNQLHMWSEPTAFVTTISCFQWSENNPLGRRILRLAKSKLWLISLWPSQARLPHWLGRPFFQRPFCLAF